MTHLKILLSFATLLSTCQSQFGVQWPELFSTLLSYLATFCLDIDLLTHLCLFKISFYQHLWSAHAGVAVLLLATYVLNICSKRRHQKKLLTFAVYFLIFIFPLMSRQIVETFSCQNVNGVWFLRADYAMRCEDRTSRVVYSAVLFFVYVLGLPLFILVKLFEMQAVMKRERVGSEGFLLSSLLSDYKQGAPHAYWDFQEIVRKLVLSTIGSFWAPESSASIATALLISIGFLGNIACMS